MKTLAATTTAAGTASRPARMLALRGALLLAFGLVEGALILAAFRLPHVTVSVLVLVMSGFFVLDAIAAALQASHAREPWLERAPQALASLAAGLLMLVVPHGRWLAVFAGWALVSGVLDAIESLSSGSGRLLMSGLSLALGLLLLLSPIRDSALLLLAVAAYGVAGGIVRLRAGRSALRQRARF
ncbi:MAG TPA: hypothetical protein VGM22_17010 [Methylomirabilota bacterium]|jgi:uncharacterized membrane protein HdeD (DUF308 family)